MCCPLGRERDPTPPVAMGACLNLVKALGDELEGDSIRNFKGFTGAQHHDSGSSDSEPEDADVADGAAAGSTMRRRH